MDISKTLEPIAGDLAAMEGELGALSARIASSDGARPAPSGILEQISLHPFSVPGKRLRPALVLLAHRAAAGEAGGGAREAAIGLATAVEVLHSASLVHDDIIDGADERRHQVSLNKRFGDRVAVLAGDILYTEFFSLVTSLPLAPGLRFRLLSLFLETTRKMCVGEILAQESRAPGAAAGPARVLGFDEYLEICGDKTASLFAACCEGGALVGGAGEGQLLALREFGLLFGLTFQMLDDISDGDHALDPAVDLRARAREYAERAKQAATALGPAEAGVSGLLEYVVARDLVP